MTTVVGVGAAPVFELGTKPAHTRAEDARSVRQGDAASPMGARGPRSNAASGPVCGAEACEPDAGAAVRTSGGSVRHLYVHLPFCAHRCGYCDFVTVVGGGGGRHGAYVDAVLAELRLEQHLLAPSLTSVFLGGGTPTFTDAAALTRLLAGLPQAAEVTVEANPETVTPQLAALLREHGVDRVSLGAQTFQQPLQVRLAGHPRIVGRAGVFAPARR